MFVVEYLKTGKRKMRDGDGHEHPMRIFKRRRDMEIFMFEPFETDDKMFKITRIEDVEDNYPDISGRLLKRAEEVTDEHAHHAEMWDKAAMIKSRSDGALSRPWVMKRLIEDPEYFDKLNGLTDTEKQKKAFKEEQLRQERGRIDATDFLPDDVDDDGDEDSDPENEDEE